MRTSGASAPALQAALRALIDYAGLFPPAQLPLEQALAEYSAARAGPHAWMLGRFIVPALLLQQLPEAPAVPLSAIVEPSAAALAALAALREHGMKIEAIEIPPAHTPASPAKLLFEAGLAAVPTFVEIARAQLGRDELAEQINGLARDGLGAKLRCGGTTREAFPSVEEVARFIAAVVRVRVPFKATAGLHHPVRRVDGAGGLPMHGFLNILAAAALAPRVDGVTLERIIAEEDAGAFAFDDTSFAWRDERIDVTTLAMTRRTAFVSYGSCSFAEPVDDLIALRMLQSS
jgi:hypothetical protein